MRTPDADTAHCCHSNGYTQTNWSFFSWDAYERLRSNTPAFEELAALQVGQAELGVRRAGSSAPAQARTGEYVSGNFFRTLGIVGWRGRLFTNADDEDGTPPVAVMSFRAGAAPVVREPRRGHDAAGEPMTITI